MEWRGFRFSQMQPRWIVPYEVQKKCSLKALFCKRIQQTTSRFPSWNSTWMDPRLPYTVGVSEIRKTQSNKWRLVTIFVTGFHISDISKNWFVVSGSVGRTTFSKCDTGYIVVFLSPGCGTAHQGAGVFWPMGWSDFMGVWRWMVSWLPFLPWGRWCCLPVCVFYWNPSRNTWEEKGCHLSNLLRRGLSHEDMFEMNLSWKRKPWGKDFLHAVFGDYLWFDILFGCTSYK